MPEALVVQTIHRSVNPHVAVPSSATNAATANPPCRMPPDVPTNVPTISSVRRYVLGHFRTLSLPVPDEGGQLLRGHLGKIPVLIPICL